MNPTKIYRALHRARKLKTWDACVRALNIADRAGWDTYNAMLIRGLPGGRFTLVWR